MDIGCTSLQWLGNVVWNEIGRVPEAEEVSLVQIVENWACTDVSHICIALSATFYFDFINAGGLVSLVFSVPAS